MTGGAGRVAPVRLQLLPHRLRRGRRAFVAFLERRDVRRRRGRRRVQERTQNVLAAKHWRGSGRNRGERQDAPLSQKASPVGIGQLHLAKALAVNTPDAVVLGEPLVDERVVGAQQLEGASVPPHDVAEEQLCLQAERLSGVVVEIGEHQQIGRDLRLEVAELEPLPGEITDQGIGAFVGNHAAYLGLERARPAKAAGGRQVQQRLVGNAAPEKEGQARGELHVADRVGSACPQAGGIAFDSVQEGRAGQDTRDPGANARVEVAAALARLLVERDRRLHIRCRDRSAIGAARQVGEDPGGARELLLRHLRLTHEDQVAAWRGADPRHAVGAFDAHGLQPRLAANHVYFLAVAQGGLPHVLRLRRPLSPGEAHVMRTCGHGDTAGHARVDERARLVHVLCLDFVVLEAADLRGIHLRTVNRDDEGVRQIVALNSGVAFLHSPDQPPGELVFAVGRKHMTDHGAAACPERQAVDVPFLGEFAADRILDRPGHHVRIAHRLRADALRRGQIPLEQEWRRVQRGRDVVEAEVRAVARQQPGHVDVERQQIANRVAVFSAVQAMHDVAARTAPPHPRAVERSGQPAGKSHIVGFGRVRHALGRHRAHTQFTEHALPRGRVGQQVVEAGRFEIDRIVRRRCRAAVMTTHAVPIQPGSVFGPLGRR